MFVDSIRVTQMKYLRNYQAVQTLERFVRVGVETPENEGRFETLFEEAIEACFGIRYNTIPDWFFEEEEEWDNTVDLLRWGRERGYDLSDEFGALLQNAEQFAYVIEAIERRVVTVSDELVQHHADKAWASGLERDAATFRRQNRR